MIKKLRRPIPALAENQEPYTELKVREYITAGDMLAHRRVDDAFEGDCVLIGRITGLDPIEVRSMDILDVQELQEKIREWMTLPEPEPEAEPDAPPKN